MKRFEWICVAVVVACVLGCSIAFRAINANVEHDEKTIDFFEAPIAMQVPEEFKKAIESDKQEAIEESKRSPHWPTLEKKCVAAHPYCAYCGISQQQAKEEHNNLAGHHKHVFHLMTPDQRGSSIPGGELDPDNVIILCFRHHFEIGHLRNWKSENPYVVEECKANMERMKAAGTWPIREH